MTPRRPRAHVLEEESVRAFSDAIPARWIIRDESHDYGIDRSVEIVDEAGKVSGKRFFVQLKATDSISRSKALSVPLRHETVDYYKSLDLPVLLVRYHSPSERLFAHWAHDLDRFYGRRGRKSHSFKFEESSILSAASWHALECDLDGWRWIRSPSLRLPVDVSVRTASQVEGVNAIDIARAIDSLTRPLRHLICFSELHSGGFGGVVQINPDGIRVDFPGGCGAMLHAGPLFSNASAKETAADALLFVGLALANYGHGSISVHLLLAACRHAPSVRELETAMMAARVICAQGYAPEAVELAIDLVALGASNEVAQLLVGAAILASERTPESERPNLAKALSGWVRCLESYHYADDLVRAIANYNAGRFLGFSAGCDSRTNDYRAFRYYLRAARLDPSYRQRSYFWCELGALAFDAGRPAWSAMAYLHSTEFGKEPEVEARLGDALAHSGRFAESERSFNQYLESAGDDVESHWALKAFTLPRVHEAAGSSVQRRNSLAARSVLLAVDDSPYRLQTAVAREVCDQALALDALCSAAWFERGLSSIDEERGEAFIEFLLAALYAPNDLPCWANCVLAGFAMLCNGTVDNDSSERHLKTFNHVLLAGRNLHGDELFRSVVSVLEAAHAPDHAEALMLALQILFRSVEPSRIKKEVRIHATGETVRVPF